MADKPTPEGVHYFPPERVVTRVHAGNFGGSVEQAVSYARAAADGIEPDVILVRDDGWTLGARWEDARAAYRTWAETWVFFVYRDGTIWRLRQLATFSPLVDRVLAATPPRRPNDKGGSGDAHG